MKTSNLKTLLESRKKHKTMHRELFNGGTRQVRNSMEACNRRLKEILDSKHNSPNPRTDQDKLTLEMVRNRMATASLMVKGVKETRRKKKVEYYDTGANPVAPEEVPVLNISKEDVANMIMHLLMMDGCDCHYLEDGGVKIEFEDSEFVLDVRKVE